ncbi:MAG: STAS domain-containing protein [Hyphomicrobiales bacterium]|nr:STAS domain-containing protein [Hyphomicrobiales bacterium]
MAGKSKAGSGSGGTFVLPASMDITYVSRLHDEMCKRVDVDGDVELDAEGVERLTTPCVQVLLSLAKTLEGRGKSLKITAASEAFSAAMYDLGLCTQMEQWG